jgi:hypothetical protein
MASLSELIRLGRLQSGDLGRENLPAIHRATPQQQQATSLNLQQLAAELAQKQAQAAIAKRQQELWESVGIARDNDRSAAGVATSVVDKGEAGGRDIIEVGSYEKPTSNSGYEAAISKQGKMYLRPQGAEDKAKPYDKVKVVDRAMKLIDADLAMNGISKSTLKASDYSARLKKMLPQAEIDLYGEATTEAPAAPSYTSEDNRPVNPTGLTFGAEDFLPEYKEKRGMIEVAKDFYSGKKDKQGPAAKTSAFQEGQTAINPKTGQRIVFKGGKWQQLN